MAHFSIGRLVATAGVAGDLDQTEILSLVTRHVNGDWGELCDEDKQMNEEAVRDGERILSKYTASTGDSVYVITEWDRSYTTVLYPSEY